MTNEEALNIWLPIISMGIENMPELKEAFNMAVESLKRKWTPVSNPPKEDGRYLAYIVNKDDPRFKYSMTCQFIQNSIGDNPWFPDDECASNNVVAWMPLPEDYKERKCSTCEHAFTTGKGRWYCEKSLADKDDCGEYKMLEQRQYMEKVSKEDKED